MKFADFVVELQLAGWRATQDVQHLEIEKLWARLFPREAEHAKEVAALTEELKQLARIAAPSEPQFSEMPPRHQGWYLRRDYTGTNAVFMQGGSTARHWRDERLYQADMAHRAGNLEKASAIIASPDLNWFTEWAPIAGSPGCR